MEKNIQNSKFLTQLDNERNKIHYAKIIVLDKNERPIKFIEGEVQQGSSISINGSSAVRRTCNITIIATEEENDLVNIEHTLSANKRIKILIGIEKDIDYSRDIYYYNDKSDIRESNENPYDYGFPKKGEKGIIYADRATRTYWKWNGKKYEILNSIYDYQKEIVWFPMGIFVIVQPNISHSASNCTISLNCKDKMCLLNGEMGGMLPASVTFHEYNQTIGVINCSTNPIEDPNIQPNTYNVYHDVATGKDYTWDPEKGWKEESDASLIIGTVVPRRQLIYDIVKTLVVNYGEETESNVFVNDIPFEIKQLARYTGGKTLYVNEDAATDNYTFSPVDKKLYQEYTFNEDVGYKYEDFIYQGTLISGVGENVCSVLDKIKNHLGNFEYFYDINGHFIFQEIRNYLNNSYNPEKETMQTKQYYLSNSRDAGVTLASNQLQIISSENYKVDYYADQKSVYTFEEGNGLIISYSNTPNYANLKNDYHIWGKDIEGKEIHYHAVLKNKPVINNGNKRTIVFLKDSKGYFTGKIKLYVDNGSGIIGGKKYENYIPNDWRAELYLEGLEALARGERPDKYQQEILDYLDDIYEFGYYEDEEKTTFNYTGRFKADMVKNPNGLKYFIDFLSPVDRLYGFSVEDLGTRIYAAQEDQVIKLYDVKVPDLVIINEEMDENSKAQLIEKCKKEGQRYSIVSTDINDKLSTETVGYSAEERFRDFLYQYTSYNETISLQSVPIYYLDVNRRITVRDKKTGINGDYIISTITMPLNAGGTMAITATKALERI